VILQQLSSALEKLRKRASLTILLGEQNITFALPHADRIYVLEHARIVWEGTPSALFRGDGSRVLRRFRDASVRRCPAILLSIC
jgi:branched-chain amino acid transport system ATP-binding protein